MAERQETTAKSSRRHESLVPLSREHQYGLLLCLRIHRGLPEKAADASWLEKKAAQTVEFFKGDLAAHFAAEEEVLFPAMREIPEAAALIAELLAQHREIESLARALEPSEEDSLPGTLKRFADLLEAHIRKEERELFPIYERAAAPVVTEAVGRGVRQFIGEALKPKHPELFD
jgi:hemerythrin-like domain-containing protein